jgi:hypothetical protein
LPTDPTAATTARTMAGRALSAPDWECLLTQPLRCGRKTPTRAQATGRNPA